MADILAGFGTYLEPAETTPGLREQYIISKAFVLHFVVTQSSQEQEYMFQEMKYEIFLCQSLDYKLSFLL